jgi:hypothetical protein
MKRFAFLVLLCVPAIAAPGGPGQAERPKPGPAAAQTRKCVRGLLHLVDKLRLPQRIEVVVPQLDALVVPPEHPPKRLLERYPTALVTPDPNRTYTMAIVQPAPGEIYTMPQIGIEEFSSQRDEPGPEMPIPQCLELKQKVQLKSGDPPQSAPEKPKKSRESSISREKD